MVKKKDLKDSIIYPEYANLVLYCDACESEYSANSGDYWNLDDEHIFKCQCGTELQLGFFSRIFTKIK